MTEEQVITRTRRKRPNRRKKKKTKTAADDDNASVASSDSESPLVASKVSTAAVTATRSAPKIVTPQESLRQSLMTEGFAAEEIDQAMETMWDKGLAYDEYEAVKKFLEIGDIIDDDEEEEDGAYEEKDPGDHNTVQTVSTEDFAGEGESSAGGDDDADTKSSNSATASSPSRSNNKSPSSMVEKLDMVARADKVTDAIFALTQWITKAAKPHELEDLCLAQKTKALVVVFQRGMEECVDQNMFDTAVLPGLVRIIFSTFRRFGIEVGSSQLAASEESMSSLLKQTRKVVMTKPVDEADSNNDIADKVATYIVSRLAAAVGEAKHALETSSPGIVKIPSLVGKRNHTHVSSLISKRETQKQATQRASALAQSSLQKVLKVQDGGSSIANGSSHSSNSGEATILQLVDGATRARFESRKVRYDELKAQVQDGESEKIKGLRTSVSDLESERLTIQEEIAEIKMALQKLEAQDEEIATKIGSLEGDIAEEQAASSEEAKKLQEQVQKAKEEARYGNLVGSLSGMMRAYAKVVEAATTKAMESAEGSTLPVEFASIKMETYLQQVLGYFQTETECFSHLKSRLEANSSSVSSLKVELEQVSGLGMDTTVGQLEETVASKQAVIKNDSKMLVACTAEATSMLDDLISRLETYTGALRTCEDLQPIHFELLADIQAEIADSGVSGCDRLNKFIPESRAASPVVVTQFTNTTASSVATPSPQANAKKTKKVAAAGGFPKLTWATASAKPEGKTSFLDIQKEELESKE